MFTFQNKLNCGHVLQVYLHNASEMPDSSSCFLDLKYCHHLTVEVITLAIHSTEDVRSLSVSQRKCCFLEESDVDISPVYSYNLCRLQCRVKQALRLCGCLPNFYRSKGKWQVHLILLCVRCTDAQNHITPKQLTAGIYVLKINNAHKTDSIRIKLENFFIHSPFRFKQVIFNIS
jgi:hypothetical protein